MASSRPISSGSGVWGLITGTINDQSDLISFLASTYFPLADFTSSFNSAFASKSTTDLSEGDNLYFTNERVDDRVASLLQAGANITLTYDDTLNTLTVASTASGGGLDLVSYSQYGGF